MRFEELGLLSELVASAGYETATPVQTAAIPAVLEGRDVLAGAQTGTGKTAAFALPILQRLYAEKRFAQQPRALVITPTRELAAQVANSFQKYGNGLRQRYAVIYGGVNFGGQVRQIKKGVDIVIATPGRLLDHVNQGTINLSHVKTLVLDEADRMLDMGFIGDIERVISLCKTPHQTLLFSATYNKGIKELATKYLCNPAEIEVAKKNIVASNVDQTFVHVDRDRKRELLTQFINTNNLHQVLVFTKTKFGADKLARALTADGLSAVAMHGNKSQAQRTKALQKFKRGNARILVATDVASRGLDIHKLPTVINFELPMVAEDYVHRIGRTGRAGEDGVAISFVSSCEHKLLRDIERVLKTEVEFQVADGFEPRTSFPVQKPKQKSRLKKIRGHSAHGKAKVRYAQSADNTPRPRKVSRSDKSSQNNNPHRDIRPDDSRQARSKSNRSGESALCKQKQQRDGSSSPKRSRQGQSGRHLARA